MPSLLEVHPAVIQTLDPLFDLRGGGLEKSLALDRNLG